MTTPSISNSSPDVQKIPNLGAEEFKTSATTGIALVQRACLVTGAVAALLFVMLPQFLTLIVGGLLGFGARELYVVARNTQEIIDQPTVQEKIRNDNSALRAHLEKDTYAMNYLGVFSNLRISCSQ
ncbi:MAG: hypothetical protein WCF19_04140 [Chlamydiales bacterium]